MAENVRLKATGIEVVVVDNSLDADGTRGVVQAANADAVYVVPASNLGFGRANNLGFARASGECVLFLNPDTVCNVEALEHCVRRGLS